jgi:hypothetical protein
MPNADATTNLIESVADMVPGVGIVSDVYSALSGIAEALGIGGTAKSNGRPTSDLLAETCLTTDVKNTLTGSYPTGGSPWGDLTNAIDKAFSDWDHDGSNPTSTINAQIVKFANVGLPRLAAQTNTSPTLHLGVVSVTGDATPYSFTATKGNITYPASATSTWIIWLIVAVVLILILREVI